MAGVSRSVNTAREREREILVMKRSGDSVKETLLPLEKRTFRLASAQVLEALTQYVETQAEIDPRAVGGSRIFGEWHDGLKVRDCYFDVTLIGRKA
ncbi:hypothetical protein LCGC14_2758800 [marine sediment metagenome]|uniref:Uncharacterized protein n=1 Tax=marine sediment metagenome TaxID=412755 RepID=A0A0F8YZM3_9ZZZZ